MDADAWYGLGDAWFHDPEGRPDRHFTESLRAFRRTLALAPDYSLAYEHIQAMLSQASRPITGMFLVSPDTFASGPGVESAVRVAATARARQAGVESARAWSTAQPATGRAHLAMVDALLANRQYPDALVDKTRNKPELGHRIRSSSIEADYRGFFTNAIRLSATPPGIPR